MAETLYERIKRLRIENNMNQTDLALALGYKDKTIISKIESGKIDISARKIMEFADALHTTPTYLMDGDKDENSPDAISSAGCVLPPGYDTPEISQMLKCMSNLSPEDQKRLLDIGRLAFPAAFNK